MPTLRVNSKTSGLLLLPMKVWPEIGMLGAASLTDEEGFEIGQSDMVGPAIAADPYPMACT